MKQLFFYMSAGILAVAVFADTWTVSTVCGATNDTGYQYDGSKEKVGFTNNVGHSVVDAQGNLFVIDMDALRKVSPDGSVDSWFGNYISDAEGNKKQLPLLDGIKGICMDKDGNLYVSEANTHSIKKIDADRQVEVYAGDVRTGAGSDDGIGVDAMFNNPRGLCIDKAGNIYVADVNNRSVRKITTSRAVTTLAGGKKDGAYRLGTGKGASFFPFQSVAVDSKGNVYVPQNGNKGNCVAKITPAGVVTTLAGDVEYLGDPNDGTGKAAHFGYITCLAVDEQDNIIVGEKYRIRKITPAGVVTTLAGGNEPQWRDAEGAKARFGMISGISLNAKGEIYVSDLYCIRKMVKK